MAKPRNPKADLPALAMAAAAAFLVLAVASYDPADSTGLVYPANQQAANLCGRAGAFAADLLFQTLGLGAYYLVASLAGMCALLLSRRAIPEPALRMAGWLMSLAGFSTLAAMALPGWSPGPVIGAGGYLGAAGRGMLQMHFATIGSYILVVSVMVAGVVLCTDYAVFRVLAWVFGVPTRTVARGLFAKGAPADAKNDAKSKLKLNRKTDVDTSGVEAPIRIRGKSLENGEELKAISQADQKSAADKQADEDDSDADTEEESEPKGMVGKLASALRIKGPMQKADRDKVMQELDAAARVDEGGDYELPSLDLLQPAEPYCSDDHEAEVLRKAKVLEKTFANFGFNIRVVEIETGPVIAQYEVELEAGLRLSKITSLAEDVAIALRVPSVRIVAPIPGKNTVGIEVPNAERQLVRLREVMEETGNKAAKMRIPVYLGKDVAGNPMVADLTTLPHLLIAGRTGTGKSVCLNTLIMSMIMTRRPDEVKMLLIDPKMVELTPYTKLPHLMHPVVTDMKKAEAILGWAVEKMEERYSLLARAGVRHISVYNQLGEEELMDRLRPENDEQRAQIPTNLPYIVIVADEMADLMMTAAKEVETHIIRLAQKSRAVGIHLVLATQKPTVDVITGLIKSNLPARIAFQVASRVDSRVVLDEMGADKLLGNGDMLFLWPGTSTLLRGQGAYVSDDEINKVVSFVGTTEPQFAAELVQLQVKNADGSEPGKLNHRDDL
ncbi:MAG: DNA translocase FtsK 4TM domain-containing protein, partial [Pirellulales bacterium]